MRARVLSASAGSGKTYRLAYKYILDTLTYYKEKPYLYRAILAVTFTNKATEEMKRRILMRYAELATNPTKSEYINDLRRDLPLSDAEYALRAKEILKDILHDYSHFTVLTIDKFFQRILRAFVKELGIDVNYNLQIEADDIVAQSADSLIDTMQGEEELQEWIMAFARENLDDSRQWGEIRESLLKLGKDALGEKTQKALESELSKQELESIIEKIEESYDAVWQHIADVGQQALDIINNAGVTLTDFKDKQKSFAHLFAKAKNKSIERITRTAWKMAEESDEWISKGGKKEAAALVPALQPLLLDICETFDDNIELIATFNTLKSRFRSFALLKDIYAKIKEVCATENMLLLSETKNLLSELIKDNDTPFIYEKTGNRFERFMIDEFQDTSRREWNNFIPLLLNAMAMAEDEAVFIVGDIKQAIYRWRGGDWRILHSGVEDALGRGNTITQPLEDNWRSRECIVEFNNTYISRIVENLNTRLNDLLDDGVKSMGIDHITHKELYNTLQKAYSSCKQTARKIDDKKGYVRIEKFEEQPNIVGCITDAIARGYSYNDIMILHRGAKDIQKTVKILMHYKEQGGATFNIKTRDSLTMENSDIANFIIAILRLSQNSRDNISLAIANRYLKRSYQTKLSDEELTTLNYIGQLSTEQAFEKIVTIYSLAEKKEEIAFLQALHENIVAFTANKSADIQHFLEEWEATFKTKSLIVEENDTTIELTTIHTAKGLERKIIIIPYCNWAYTDSRRENILWATPNSTSKGEIAKLDYFPVKFSSGMGATAFSEAYYYELIYSYVDAMNLLYVALTRAVDELYIYIPPKGKPAIYNVGDTLWEELSGGNEEATLYEFGSRTPKKSKSDKDDKVENIILADYPTSDDIIAMRLPLQRYFEERESTTNTAREVGIMMHSILSKSQSISDVEEAIEEAFTAGRIDTDQRTSLRQIIEQELRRHKAVEWFSEDWDKVYNECDIIHPDNNTIGLSRPDRVMVKGERAVIVDYKFGSQHSNNYTTKMQLYKELLTHMGYSQVEGYIWYLTRSEIETV